MMRLSTAGIRAGISCFVFLCLGGGVEVDLNWQAGHLAAADLKPTIDGPQRVRLPTGSVAVEIRSSAKALPIDLDNEGALRLDMHAGDVYEIRAK